MKDIRNMGFIAHIDAGKTTTTERVLFFTGKVHRIGEVDDGAATMDWMTQEKERGITIGSATTSVNWNGKTINIIDTPGHIDFTVEVERSLRILDGACIIFSAVEGVEPQSETVWKQSNKYRLPKISYINKMDRMGADFFRVLNSMRKVFKVSIIPVQLPIGSENDFNGIIDLISMKAYIWQNRDNFEYTITDIPESMLEQAESYRNELLEELANSNENILDKLLNDEKLTENEIIDAIREETINFKIVPILCGSSKKNIGVRLLLNAIVNYLPSPEDRPPIQGVHPNSKDNIKRYPNIKQPFCALVFKIEIDKHFGKLAYIRVYSGEIKVKDMIYDSTYGEKTRINKIFMMHSNKRIEVGSVSAGNICAVAGLKKSLTGSTLTHPKHPIILEKPVFPEPVVSVSIEARTKEEEKKLNEILDKLQEVDPTFKVFENEDTGQKLISGMGELHIEVIVEEIYRQYNIKPRIGKPIVTYRETISNTVEEEFEFDKMLGQSRLYAYVKIRMEPYEKYFEFKNTVDKNILPLQFSNAIKEGIETSMNNGIIAGFPVINVKITLLEARMEHQLSNENAFRYAASQAFKNAMYNAKAVLLEPIMKLIVNVPEEYIGNIINDLNSKYAIIKKIEHNEDRQLIYAEVALSEMFGYSNRLRTITQGRGVFSMEFYEFRNIPPNKLTKIKETLGIF